MEPITLLAVVGGVMSFVGALKALQLRGKEDAQREAGEDQVKAATTAT
jgi:hypothetical protein